MSIFKQKTIWIAAAVVAVTALLTGIYVMKGPSRNELDARSCKTSPETLAEMRKNARGTLAALAVPAHPRPLPDLAFLDGEGKPKRLSSFGGRTILLNLWATWCAPCRQEMPMLDKLQADMGDHGFEVVAVSLDVQGAFQPRAFLSEAGVEHLAFYGDPSGKLFQDLKKAGRLVGLPTTLLIDAAGCEIGYLPGPAEWSSEEARAVIKSALPFGGP